MASPRLGLPKHRISPRDLHAWPLLTLTRQSNLHKLLGTWFEANDATARHIDVCNSISVLAALTIAGLGVSFLPREHFAHEVKAGRLQVLEISPKLPDLEYFAVYEKRQMQPLSQAVAELARQNSTFTKGRERKAPVPHSSHSPGPSTRKRAARTMK